MTTPAEHDQTEPARVSADGACQNPAHCLSPKASPRQAEYHRVTADGLIVPLSICSCNKPPEFVRASSAWTVTYFCAAAMFIIGLAAGAALP